MTSTLPDFRRRPIRIAPSVLAADFGHLAKCVAAAHAAGAHYLHFDVMDAQFVPNLSFGPSVIKSVRGASSRLFDVHLMVCDPLSNLDLYLSSEGNLFTVHVEACKDLPATIQAIRKAKKRVGLAIKPNTPVDALAPFLAQIDLALVMSVEPGWGGQSFQPEMLTKVRGLRDAIDGAGLDVRLQVDGGINAETAVAAVAAGADVLVAGSSVFAEGQTVASTMARLARAVQQAGYEIAPVP